MQVFLTNAAV